MLQIVKRMIYVANFRAFPTCGRHGQWWQSVTESCNSVTSSSRFAAWFLSFNISYFSRSTIYISHFSLLKIISHFQFLSYTFSFFLNCFSFSWHFLFFLFKVAIVSEVATDFDFFSPILFFYSFEHFCMFQLVS